MPDNTAVFMDPDAPLEARVADIVSKLTLEEKALQMLMNAPAVERLGIPQYDWWNECLHGVGRAGLATVFPQSIGLAAMWDKKLTRSIADVISTEARAKHHQALREDNRQRYFGLTFWTPNINIFRDPRWGRGQETYGEDPYLTARLGVAFVKGLQGDDPKYFKTTACAKHYAVHSGPEKLRHGFDAKVSQRDLWETYLPAFEALVKEANVASVMGAYNRVNGEPCCASKTLLVDILRGKWKFRGHVVSDCGAICDIFQSHKTVEQPQEAAALAANAGLDLNCGESYSHLARAAHLKLIAEETINQSVSRLMRDRIRLGMFDPPARVPYASIPYEAADCPQHAKVALQAARESIVLLKNDGNLLPVKAADIKTIAVIGPNADNQDVLLGNYNGTPSAPVTLLAGIHAALPKAKVLHVKGCELTGPIHEGAPFYAALEAARRADLVVMCMGISPKMEGEEGAVGDPDRSTLELPEVQNKLMQEVHKAGKPIVLVLTGGSPLAPTWASQNIPAILMAWYPGQSGGTAVADVLLGKYNPAGRLPLTLYKSVDQLPPFEDYNMQGRTYRFFKDQPMYPFGFGLSYTKFQYANLKVDQPQLPAGKAVKVTVDITNTGQLAGDEVAQLYITDMQASVPTPIRQLAGFERIRLAPGQTRSVTFTVKPMQMTCVRDDGMRMIEPGQFELSAGGGQPVPSTPGNVVKATFTVTGESPKLMD
jgi:beta-glucosidase